MKKIYTVTTIRSPKIIDDELDKIDWGSYKKKNRWMVLSF